MSKFNNFLAVQRAKIDPEYRRFCKDISYNKYVQLFFENIRLIDMDSDFQLAFEAMIFTSICAKMHNENYPKHLQIEGKELCNRVLQTTQIESKVFRSLMLIYKIVNDKIRYKIISTVDSFTFQADNLEEVLLEPAVKAFLDYQTCV
jgi:hypothetical protein